jgi:hypothetical protein
MSAAKFVPTKAAELSDNFPPSIPDPGSVTIPFTFSTQKRLSQKEVILGSMIKVSVS